MWRQEQDSPREGNVDTIPTFPTYSTHFGPTENDDSMLNR